MDRTFSVLGCFGWINRARVCGIMIAVRARNWELIDWQSINVTDNNTIVPFELLCCCSPPTVL